MNTFCECVGVRTRSSVRNRICNRCGQEVQIPIPIASAVTPRIEQNRERTPLERVRGIFANLGIGSSARSERESVQQGSSSFWSVSPAKVDSDRNLAGARAEIEENRRQLDDNLVQILNNLQVVQNEDNLDRLEAHSESSVEEDSLNGENEVIEDNHSSIFSLNSESSVEEVNHTYDIPNNVINRPVMDIKLPLPKFLGRKGENVRHFFSKFEKIAEHKIGNDDELLDWLGLMLEQDALEHHDVLVARHDPQGRDGYLLIKDLLKIGRAHV